MTTPSAPRPTTTPSKSGSPRAHGDDVAVGGDELDARATAVARLPLASPEPWVAVAIAPAIEMCGSDARLCSASPARPARSASSPYLSPALQVTVPAPAVDDDVGRQAVERDQLGGVGDVAERVARAERVHARRAAPRSRAAARASPAGAARRRGRRGCRPSWRAPRQARPRARSISRPRTRSPSARRPLCSYSLVSHGRRPRMCAAVSSEKRALDVHVLGVDRGGDRHLVGAPGGRRRTGAATRARRGCRRPRAAAPARRTPRTSTGRRARR